MIDIEPIINDYKSRCDGIKVEYHAKRCKILDAMKDDIDYNMDELYTVNQELNNEINRAYQDAKNQLLSHLESIK